MNNEVGAVASLQSSLRIGLELVEHCSGLRLGDTGFFSHSIDNFVGKPHQRVNIFDVSPGRGVQKSGGHPKRRRVQTNHSRRRVFRGPGIQIDSRVELGHDTPFPACSMIKLTGVLVCRRRLFRTTS